MTVKGVIATVKSNLEPSRSEDKQIKQSKEIKQVVDRVNSLLKKAKLKAKAEIGGSYAKKTNLANDYDVDIFVRFNLTYQSEKISNLLAKVLKPLKVKRVHGSRDYFQLKKAKLNLEFVPVLNIRQTNQAQNITDCSPLHTKWFIKKGKGREDEVKLAKLFCKAQGVYGAESYIRGFSGHTLDILVVHYKGFERLLKASLKWKEKTVIDPEKIHKGRALKKLNSSKTQGPLIVIDPIEPMRNAASGLHNEKFHRFIAAASQFLNNPSEESFTIKQLDLKELKKKYPSLLQLDITALTGKEDVVGSKLLKIYKTLRQELQEFSIIDSGWDWDKNKKSILWYGVAKKLRDKEVLIQGPPLKAIDHAENFKKKHKNAFVKKSRLYAKKKRKIVNIKKLTEDLLKQPHLKNRMKKCSVKLL